MKVAVLFSGGKDSVFAAFCCLYSGWDVELLTVVPAEYSTMFHHPNVKWCAAQAEAMGVPIRMVTAKGKTEADELSAMKEALRAMGAEGVASGAIESEYQKERVDRIAGELEIASFSPVWRTNGAMLDEIVKYFDAYVVAVSAEGLGENDLCMKFDADFVARLRGMKPEVSAHLEGGEGETFVANAPFFGKALRIGEWKKSFSGSSGVAEIISLS